MSQLVQQHGQPQDGTVEDGDEREHSPRSLEVVEQGNHERRG